MRVSFNVTTKVVRASSQVRHVVTAQVPVARGPRGKTGDRGPPGTIGGDAPVVINGGFF